MFLQGSKIYTVEQWISWTEPIVTLMRHLSSSSVVQVQALSKLDSFETRHFSIQARMTGSKSTFHEETREGHSRRILSLRERGDAYM